MTAQLAPNAGVPPTVSVLVVDDDMDIRVTVGEVLQDEGYSVGLAGNGAEALQFLATRRPAFILLDLSMPVMNGAEFRRLQMADPTIASIPVVIFSAADRMRSRIQDLAADDALAKPVDIERLRETVLRYCGPPKPQSS